MVAFRRNDRRGRNGMRLSTRLLLLIVVCLAPLVAAQLYTELDLRRLRHGQIAELALRQAEMANADIASIVDGARQMAFATAQFPEVQTLAPDCGARLAKLQRGLPAYRFLAVVDAEGRLACSSAPALLTDGTRAPDWFGDLTRAEGFGIGRLAVSPGMDGPFLPMGLRVGADDSQSPASRLIVMALDLRWLGEHLQTLQFGRTRLLEHSTLMITDRDGNFLARLPDLDSMREAVLLPELKPLVGRDTPGVTSVASRDGRQRLAAYIPATLPPVGLATIVALYPPDLTTDVDQATWRQTMLLVGATLLALVLTYLVGRRFIFRPTERLLAAAQRWRAGDLSARADVTETRSEFGALATSFNAMATTLQARDLECRLEAELLEAQVAERTRELSETNNRLQVEIAEREKTEAALHQARKLQAVGQLAGGIAHDFNNMLATILGSLKLMERRLPGGGEPWPDANVDRLRILIERATGAVQRGAQLTSRLLAFSRRQRLSARPTDLNRLVTDLVTLATSTLGRRVRVVTDLAADLWPAQVDPSQVEAAILNLCLNARDAMPEGGQLTITAANEMITDRAAPDDPEPGDYVRVSIADTGTGMTPEVLRRAFDPFFTTKGPGGSGLGLSQVYGVARQSGGTVRITSATGEGTTVALLLPRAAAAVKPDAARRGADALRRADPPTLVLVVDDDPAVRQVTMEMLKDLGYDVAEAPAGSDALALLDGEASGASIVLLDYAMPGMNGLQLARAIRDRQLTMPIVLATGFAELADPADADATLLDGLLRKPFSIRELQTTLTRVRGRRHAVSNVVPLRAPKRG